MATDCCSSTSAHEAASTAVTKAYHSLRDVVNKNLEGKDPFSVILLTLATLGALKVPGYLWRYYQWKSEGKGFKGWLMSLAVDLIPAAKRKLNEERRKAKESMEESLLKESKEFEANTCLPETGMQKDKLMEVLNNFSTQDMKKWGRGTISGAVYHGGADMTDVIAEAFKAFALSNPLHPDVFPMVRKMEAEVVAMMINLLHGNRPNERCCGTMTSGGTESILMACKAYRDWGRKEKGIGNGIGPRGGMPEIIAGVSVHAAFDKAADYFGIKLVHVPVDPVTGRVDVRAVKRAITCRTVCIVGSAPSFPHGVIDDIQALAKIAKRYNVGLHVDSCLGGLLLPFLPAAGHPLAPWDFRVDGVTSISADTHKYGFAPKGSSVIMYSSVELRKYQYFVNPDWMGGIYASPAIAGSRPGALVASTWAAMMKMGRSGYVECAKKIMMCADAIRKGIETIPELKVCGQSEVMVIGFTVKEKENDVFKVNDAMTKRGWNLNALQFPSSLHICVTYANSDCAEKFIHDLRESIDEIKNNPGMYKDGASAIYGMAQSIPDRSIVSDLASSFLDVLYQP